MSALEQLMARARDVRADDVDADGIRVRVREPTAAGYARYISLIKSGDTEAAMASLLHACVIGDDGAPCLTAEQARVLAQAPQALVMPIANRILTWVMPEKKADAPAADGVPDQLPAGAAAE